MFDTGSRLTLTESALESAYSALELDDSSAYSSAYLNTIAVWPGYGSESF